MQKTILSPSKIVRVFALCGLFFFQLSWPSVLEANISNSFPSSLTHQGTGLYKWSTWDYLTTPYIYHLEKKNAVSVSFTPNFLNGSYGGAVKYTIPLSPVLDKLPLIIAFSIKNNGFRYFSGNATGDTATETIETIDREIKVMFGTTLSELFGIDLGLGFYVITGKFQLNLDLPTEGAGTGNFENYTSLSLANWRGNIYGIELGQFYELPNSKNSWAWSFSFEYASRGDKSEVVGEYVTEAPRLRVFTRFSDVFREDYDIRGHGKKREEITTNLVGWLPAGYTADAGAQLSLNVPFGSGKDIRYTGDDAGETVNDVSISGLGLSGGLFYDKDFYLTPDSEDRSVFRIAPIITFFHVAEEVNYSASQQKFSFRDTNINIGISFKILYYVTQKFYLMMGWNPFLTLYSYYREAKLDTEGNENFAEVKEPAGKAQLTGYSFALGYDLIENMSLYFYFGNLRTTGGVVPAAKVSSSSELEKTAIRKSLERGDEPFLDFLSKITLGMDYRF